jgi:hypothetical protein
LVDILRRQYKWDELVVFDNNDIKNMNTTFNYQPDNCWNEKWVVEPGEFEIMVGTNSVELQKLKLLVK